MERIGGTSILADGEPNDSAVLRAGLHCDSSGRSALHHRKSRPRGSIPHRMVTTPLSPFRCRGNYEVKPTTSLTTNRSVSLSLIAFHHLGIPLSCSAILY
eukprot:7308848-Pyramimonas_sp.AAC.3